MTQTAFTNFKTTPDWPNLSWETFQPVRTTIFEETDVLVADGWGRYIGCFQADNDFQWLYPLPRQTYLGNSNGGKINFDLDQVQLIEDTFIQYSVQV